MSDVKFEVSQVFRHACAMAERRAVLWTLAAQKDMTKDGAVEAAVLKVLGLWRRRCNVLREVGWNQARTVRFQYMRNCPPSTVRACVSGSVRPCNMRAICPWCWCRLVVKATWDKVFGGMTRLSTLGTPEDPYKLALVSRMARMEDGPLLPRLAFDATAGTMDRTARALKAKGAVGWAMLSVVQPGKAGTRRWVYGTRVLALVPRDYEVPAGGEVAPSTRRGVAAAVGKFARYPAGMMFGDPELAIRLMAERGEHRLLRSAGAFYGGRAAGADAPTADRYLDL